MSWHFNMLSRFVIAFLPRRKHLLISWLQSPSAVIFEPKKRKSVIPSWITALSWQRSLCNSVKLWTIPCRSTQDGWVIAESSDKTWPAGGGNGKPPQYTWHEDLMNCTKGIILWLPKLRQQKNITSEVKVLLKSGTWKKVLYVTLKLSRNLAWRGPVRWGTNKPSQSYKALTYKLPDFENWIRVRSSGSQQDTGGSPPSSAKSVHPLNLCYQPVPWSIKTPDNCPNHYRHLCACLYLEPLLLLSSLCSGGASGHKECHHVPNVAEWCFQTPLFSVIQAGPTLCNPTNCSPPGFSVHWILQARILEWVAMGSFRGSPYPGIKSGSPALQANSLPSEPQGKPS